MLMLFPSPQCNVSQLRRNYAQLYLIKILLPLNHNFIIIAGSELIFEISDNAYLEQRLLLKIINHQFCNDDGCKMHEMRLNIVER